nr:MAG TPA: hypothetical protein [Caudoviricetes sp.]
MLHHSFYIQGNSATIRFPILPHFVSENPPHFVFRIIRTEINFRAHKKIFSCARKSDYLRTAL